MSTGLLESNSNCDSCQSSKHVPAEIYIYELTKQLWQLLGQLNNTGQHKYPDIRFQIL